VPCAVAALPGTLPSWSCGLEQAGLIPAVPGQGLKESLMVTWGYRAKVFTIKGGITKKTFNLVKTKKEVVSLACIKHATG